MDEPRPATPPLPLPRPRSGRRTRAGRPKRSLCRSATEIRDRRAIAQRVGRQVAACGQARKHRSFALPFNLLSRRMRKANMQLRTEEIEAYLLVVELGSVSGAARRMSLSKSVVSKRINDLERSLGVTLLQRSTRRVQATESGQHFYDRARAAMTQLTHAAESISETSQQLCGELRILAPMSFGTLWLSPLIAGFASAYPRLHVVMDLDDRVVDIGHERADVAIHASRLGDSALIARRLAVSRRVVCCSPAYAARAGLPASIGDIARHACLSYGNSPPGGLGVPGPHRRPRAGQSLRVAHSRTMAKYCATRHSPATASRHCPCSSSPPTAAEPDPRPAARDTARRRHLRRYPRTPSPQERSARWCNTCNRRCRRHRGKRKPEPGPPCRSRNRRPAPTRLNPRAKKSGPRR